ncbi:MAG: hypothetical protein K5697_12130 [Lachnospiraceae bacterium]|nr:hypothetical protein [Lachnospiraceae bacterium]
MKGNSEEMFIHFAYYRGEAKKRGLMFAAAVSGEEPVIVEMLNEFIPEDIAARLHDHEVRKYYILPYDIFSEMLRICNVRRCQGQGSWISLGRRLAWLGMQNERETDENKLGEIFPATGRAIKKYENDFKTFCFPNTYTGKMCNPEVHIEEWNNVKKYLSAVVKLEQEFVNWCRVMAFDFSYEKIRCHGIRKEIIDRMLEEAWLQDGRIHDGRYWGKRYREWKETISGENSFIKEKYDTAAELENEYALSYIANESAVRYLSLDAMSVWNGDRCKSPEFILRYIPQSTAGRYCLIKYRDLEKRVLMQQAGISAYEADRACKSGLNTETADKMQVYIRTFADVLGRVLDEHGSGCFDEYSLSWFGSVLVIKHDMGRALLLNRPQKADNTGYGIRYGEGLMISIPRLIGLLAYQKAEMLSVTKSVELIKLGIRTISIKGCRILAYIPSSLKDNVFKMISMRLQIDKYVKPELNCERGAYGNDQ